MFLRNCDVRWCVSRHVLSCDVLHVRSSLLPSKWHHFSNVFFHCCPSSDRGRLRAFLAPGICGYLTMCSMNCVDMFGDSCFGPEIGTLWRGPLGQPSSSTRREARLLTATGEGQYVRPAGLRLC